MQEKRSGQPFGQRPCPPHDFRVAWRLKIRSVVDVMVTPAPLFMRSTAVAKPMPCWLPHPVTRATRFSNRFSLMGRGVSDPLWHGHAIRLRDKDQRVPSNESHCWILRQRPCQKRLKKGSRVRGGMGSITPVSSVGDRTCLLRWIVLPRMAARSVWPATCPRQSPCCREYLLFSRPGNIHSEPSAWFPDRIP